VITLPAWAGLVGVYAIVIVKLWFGMNVAGSAVKVDITLNSLEPIVWN
jgi:hypothetical protein